MDVTRSLDFDVQLSAKDRETIKHLVDRKCEVQKLAKLTVQVRIELRDKLPKSEAKP